MARKYPKAGACTAKAKSTGKPCTRPAIKGGNVCRYHGGAAPQVKRKAAERYRQYVQEMVDPDRVLAEDAMLAFSDVGDVMDENGNIKPIGEWPEFARRAIQGLEVVKRNLTAGDGEVDEILKVKLWDKGRSLERLEKHLGLLVDKSEVTIKGDIEARLTKARERLAAAKKKGKR